NCGRSLRTRIAFDARGRISGILRRASSIEVEWMNQHSSWRTAARDSTQQRRDWVMSYARLVRHAIAIAGVTAMAATNIHTYGQTDGAPTNDAPNPYQSAENYFKLPDGRTWGSTSAVEIDKDGKTIWIAERCGQNGCLDRASGQMSSSDPILHF